MNRILIAVLLVFSACPAPVSSIGPGGPTGPQGLTGDRGPQGPAGLNGTNGLDGMGGPQGPMGVQGAMGAVLVLDGGVVTGPAGSSVITSPIPLGDPVCALGGVRLTQLSDAGITRVCNGATGPAGVVGPAGATGGVGPAGPAGATGGVGPAGATGGVGPAGATGGVGAAGATGGVGPAGPAGLAGPAGAPGSTGPAGAVLYLDGGVVALRVTHPSWAGLTTFTTTGAPTGPGSQIGRLSMNARCDAEFAGSHLCSDFEWNESTPTDAVPVSGAWLEFSGADNMRTASTGTCNAFSVGTSVGGYSRMIATQSGLTANSPTNVTCGNSLPIACCRKPAAPLFRGLTSFVTNGAPTGPGAQIGRLSMHARCHAEFPGSHLCTDFEWNESTPTVGLPSPGAWLEFSAADNTRTKSTGTCNSWTVGTSVGGFSRMVATPSGLTANSPASVTCGNLLPIACCE